MSIFGKLLGIVELCRPANAITAGTGPAAAALLTNATPLTAIKLFLAGSFVYVAGTALNDILDRKHDAITRPERPLPRGAVSLVTATSVVAVAFFAALLIALSVSTKMVLWYCLVSLLAVGYDKMKRNIFVRFIFMGAARGTNWAAGLVATAARDFLWVPFAVFGWTQLLTFAGLKREHKLVTLGVLSFSFFDAVFVTIFVGWYKGIVFWMAVLVAVLLSRFVRVS